MTSIGSQKPHAVSQVVLESPLGGAGVRAGEGGEEERDRLNVRGGVVQKGLRVPSKAAKLLVVLTAIDSHVLNELIDHRRLKAQRSSGFAGAPHTSHSELPRRLA